jgi:hypothetical protein
MLLDEAKATYSAKQEASPPNRHQPPPQSAQPPSNPTSAQESVPTDGMTLEAARAIKIGIGNHKGKTLGQLETEWPEGISWYITDYKGKNENLRKGAQVIINNLNNAA